MGPQPNIWTQGLPYSWPAHYRLSYSANYLSYAAPPELSYTLLDHTAPFWTTLHPSELRGTLLSYDALSRAMLHLKKYTPPPKKNAALLLLFHYLKKMRFEFGHPWGVTTEAWTRYICTIGQWTCILTSISISKRRRNEASTWLRFRYRSKTNRLFQNL
jgi:hypothetical protein